MKRRLFSLFLALTLVVGMLPAPAFAQETEPTQVTEAPTEAPATEAPATEVPATEAPAAEVPATEAPAAEVPAAEPAQPTTEAPTEAPEAAEVPAEETAVPGEDEAVTAVQAMIDALPDVDHMSEEYIDALEAAYSAYETLSEAQQAKITGVEKLEALFNWVNSQVSTLAEDVKEISGEVTWNNQTFTTPVKLTGETTLTLVGDNKIQCDAPLDLNNCSLTVKGTGSLTVIGNGRSNERVLNGAIFDSGYKGTKSGLGTLCLEGGTVTASGGDYNAISVRSVELQGGKLEANGGSRAGIVCSYLYTYGGSLYATGDKYGIEMRTMYAGNPGKLPILASDERDASMAEMDAGDINDILDNAKKTYYIGEVTGPMLSVKAQKGYLYEGVADQTATFSYSAKNLDGCMFGVEWTGAHPGLTAEFSLSVDQTIIVTTKNTVKQGTYELKLIARDAENVNTLATKTFTVTVLGAPITVTTQPQDASVSCKGGDLDSWQGDKKIQVTATRAEGLTEDITYQWKLEGGTELDNCTGYELFLQDLFAGGKLPQVADKPWLLSAKVYCTLTVGSYSVNTNAVTLTVNTCAHERANPNGNCQQCGEPCSSEPLLVREDGIYYAVQDTSGIGAANVGVNLVVGGTFYLTKDVIHRSLDATYTPAGDKNVILDLQGHTLESLDMGNFPVGSFTLKNGTLNQCVYSTATEGKLILDGVTFMAAYATNNSYLDITVQGESVFKEKVSFNSVEGVVHLRGGTFEKGIDTSNGAQPLALLADGYAFRNDQGIVDASIPKNFNGDGTIQVVAHTCKYVNGKCDCGRSCDHSTVSDKTGLCQECGSQVYEANVTTADGTVTGYRTLEDALRNGADATVKLLADCVAEETDEAFYVTEPLTLDLNGKRMEGPSGLVVKKGPTTILDSSPAKTGTIAGTKDWEYSGVGLWVFKDAEVTLTILGGRFEGKTDGLQLAGQNTLILKGGSFSSMHFIEGATATLRDSLAPGYAYYKADNTLYDPEDKQEVRVGLHVGAHPEHTPDSSGHCDCGYTAAAMLDTEAGKQYFADFSAAVTAAKAATGSTLTLLRDVTHSGDSGIYIDSGTFTIDWNGHTLSGSPSNNLMVITNSANVTLKDGSGNNTGGVRHTGFGRAVYIAVGSEGSVNIQGGTYSPNVTRWRVCYGSVQISGGIFANPQGHGISCALYDFDNSRHLSGMLAPDTAFAYGEDGSDLLKAYNANKSDNYRTVYAVPHTHDSFDENGVCTCGYPCPHENWTDGMCDLCGCECTHPEYTDGVCDTCGHICEHENVTDNDGFYTCDDCHLTMTVMVETADGNVSYTTDLAAALNNAEDGTTVKLLGDVSLEKNADIIGGNKTVTLNLNSHNISQKTWETIGVKGSTDGASAATLSITGSGNIPFNVSARDGSQLDMSGWTGMVGSVTVDKKSRFVGPTGAGEIKQLNPVGWRPGEVGNILLQGGTVDELYMQCFESFQMNLGSLLESGFAANSGSGYLPYDQVIKYDYSNPDTNEYCLYNLTIVPCPHTGLDSSGRCTYCGATGFVATVTKDGVTAGYTDFQSALDEICNGKRGTLKLLKDVPVKEGHPFGRISGTLDLNGKNLACRLTCFPESDLQIVNSGSDMSGMKRLEVLKGAKVTIADTAGSILFNYVWVESGSVADLLSEGSAYVMPEGTWISSEEAAAKQTLRFVVVKEVPVKSVTLTANKTPVPYGQSQTVTLTASATLSGGFPASYAWAELMPEGPAFMGKDEASFTLPAGVNVGVHTYQVRVTAGSYTLSKIIEITVTKAPGTLEIKDYPTQFTYGDTVPTPKAENFITNNQDGTFSYYWVTETGTMLEAGANPISAGTYTLHVKVASSGNYETVEKNFPVTVSPLKITNENIVYDLGENLIYNGKSQKATFRSITVNDMPLNYELTGNTATDAGSYTMTVTGQGSFTGSVEIPWEIQPRSLKYAEITQGDSLTYNGRTQTQTVASVTVDGMDRALTEGVDFQVSGNTGTNAKDYMLTVKPASNNFIGTAVQLWSIAPMDISEANVVTIDYAPLTYNGKPQTPTGVTVTADGLTVTVDVAVTPQTDAGFHDMTVTGKGNFTGSKKLHWYINSKSIEDATVNLDKELTYNGQEQTQNVSVVIVDGIEGALVKGTDFEITGNTGTDAGGYTLTVTGTGNFTGRKDVPWSIAPKDIEDAKITLGDSLTYNFEKQTQTIASVTVDGLNVPTYTVIDNEGTNAGEYTLTVVADGNFTGYKAAKWNIAPMDITDKTVIVYCDAASSGLIYNGEEQTPDVTSVLVWNAKEYKEITFQVDVTPQVNAGNYKLAILGTGNFTGRKDGFTWKIKPKDMSNAEVVLGDSLTYNGQEQTQTIRSVTVDGISSALIGGVDYLVNGNTGTDADRYDIYLSGIGNFTGTWHDEWEIAKKDVTIENTAVESSKVYDGTTAARITNTGTLSANYDGDGVQIVSGTAAYDNKNVGTGKTVTFTGFSLTGDQAGNYRLVSQPASVTADITAKPITLTVTVKDKAFDGTTQAELDTVTHTDFVAGDDVELVNGEPSFAYPCVRADIPIRFTDFRLTGADADNYRLTNAQPEGVTAEIHPTPNYLDVTNKPEFGDKTTVTVDGVEYPIEEVDGERYVNLPETGDLLTIYSFKDGTPEGSYTNYPTGMQVFRITRQEGGATAEEITEFANLLNYAGCSIRLTGTKGIRMITGIGENARTALTGARGLGGYTLEEYGTVVMRGVGTPTLENSKSHNFAYKKGKADPIFSRANGMIQYTNVLVGFSLEDCKDTLTLRPYIKLKDMTTGETVTLYGGCVSRSIGYIAKQNENTYQPGTAGYKYVHEIIDAVYGKTEQGGETK